MVTVNSTVSGMSGRSYYLEKEIGSGGEGSVFTVRGTQLVAKIYKKPIPGQEQKLLYMVYHHVPNLCDAAGNRIVTLAWPSDVLYDGAGTFIGYIMPMIDTGLEIFEICRGCTSPKAKRMFPHYSWKLNVTVAQNLAIAVDYLHSQNCIIGDMNCKNILVNGDGTISILDADSFDLTDPQTNHHFKCGAGTEDYLAPELQGRNLRADSAKFTVYTDYFALAIHIFQLLMNNYHPFNCRQTREVKNSTNVNPRLQQIVLGKSPFINRYPDVDIPLDAPMVTEMVPYYIRQNFVQTFNYTEKTVMQCIPTRTPARKWAEDLSHLLWECNSPQGLMACGDHHYLASMGQCGICSARMRYEAFRQGKTTADHSPKVVPATQESDPRIKTKQTGSSASGNTGVPALLYWGVRLYNWAAMAYVIYNLVIDEWARNDMVIIAIASILVLGIFRMEYFRFKGLEPTDCPFSGAFGELVYMIWMLAEKFIFFIIMMMPVAAFGSMIMDMSWDTEMAQIGLATLPIALNRRFFVKKVNAD